MLNRNETPNMYPGMRYRDAARAIDFLVEAFGFERHMIVPGDGGTIHHAELRFERDIIMVSSAHEDVYNIQSPADAGCVTGNLCFAVDDPDAHYARAKAAGAKIVTDLENTDYGARGYTARDPEGQLWTFSTYRPEPAPMEARGTMQMAVTPYLCANGASNAIEFYKKAFGAEETYRFEEDGRIGHAELRIGDTTIYLSDEYEPYRVLSPLTLNGNSVSLSISAPDADAVFDRAIGAGATVERPLKDEFYGRSGWLVDPFGHRWNVRQAKDGEE